MGVLCNRETKAGEGNNERGKKVLCFSAVLNDRGRTCLNRVSKKYKFFFVKI
jgi:hypothetical protein